jgi:soluble lytic murein transglycosylase
MIKGLVPGYIYMPLDSAPGDFWRLLFPLPYRSLLERYSRIQDIDPFLVAGLIRQESEFNPEAVSPAKAYGLTQIMPATGRALLKVSRRRFRPGILFRPEVNLRLGTTYLRHMYDQNSAKWELTLAAYNAGGSRVQNWITWGEYREPAEFIETIPFTETRNYVFAVLRNAQIYRKLYAEGVLAAEPVKETLASPKKAAGAKASSAKKSSGFKRTPVPKKRRSRRR